LNVMDTTLEIHAMIAAINTALAVKAPAGDPDIIATQADTYHRVAYMCMDVAIDEDTVKDKSLPTSWRGQAADSATTALTALNWQANVAEDAFTAASMALGTWADQLRTAQSQDAHGRALLDGAKTVLSQLYLHDLINIDQQVIPPFTREAAASGCHERLEAAHLAASAAADASSTLSQWLDQARAQQIRVPGVNALTAVTLAYSFRDGEAMTPTAAMLASKHLDAMSSADRAAFEKLVAGASSTTEAQYLWKAASAGYNVGQLESFDAVVHPHGNNAQWLQQHLDPGIVNSLPPLPPLPGTTAPTTASPRSSIYAAFDQAAKPDCVSASTVMARLAADPVLTLGVTTGKGPAAVGGAKVGDASQTAVAARTQNLFDQYNAYYQQQIHHPNSSVQAAAPPGWPRGTIALDDRLLTPVAGSTYHYQPLNDAADRQAALPQIEAAAASGQPVPIDVASGSIGHQMIVENYQNGELEIYNPWGIKQWVPTQQFVDAKLGTLTGPSPSKGLPIPYGVDLPQP
jgi:hypothetical protein